MWSNNKKYQRFFKAFCSCHPEDTQAKNQVNANELWGTIKTKNEKGEVDFNEELFTKLVSDFERKAAERKHKNDIRSFFGTKRINPVKHIPEKEAPGPVLDETIVIDGGPAESEDIIEDNDDTELVTKKITPAQDKLKMELTIGIINMALQLRNLL